MEPVTLTIALTGSTRVTPVCTRPDEPSAPLLIDDEQHLPAGIHVGAGGELITGRQAADLAANDQARWIPNPVAVIGEPAVDVAGQGVDPVDLVAALLSRCIAETHATTGQPPAALQLVVPAHWGPRRCSLARAAAARVGYGEPLVIAAPVAVACYATLTIGVDVPVGGLLAVLDTDVISCSVLVRLDDRDWDVLSTYPPHPAATSGPAGQPDQPSAATDTAALVAGVVSAAISGAGVKAVALTAIVCAGSPTLPPGLDTALTDKVGAHPALLARPTQAAALGGAHRLARQPGAATVWAPVPLTRADLRHVLALAASGVLSMLLLAQTLSSAYINRSGIYIDYVLVNRGELALGCLLALLTCIGAGRILTLIRVAALAEHPAPPAGSRPQRLLAAGTGIGAAVCVIYGLLAATLLPLSVGDLLTPALPALATPLVCAGWLLLILPRLYYLGGTALHQLAIPIASIATAAGGVLVLQHAYTAALPHSRTIWEAHGGGALVGIGCALLFAHTTTSRLITTALVGTIGALAFTITTYQLAAAAYMTCTGIWWLTHTFAITRDAYPRLGRPARRRPGTQQPRLSATPTPQQFSPLAPTATAATATAQDPPQAADGPATSPTAQSPSGP